MKIKAFILCTFFLLLAGFTAPKECCTRETHTGDFTCAAPTEEIETDDGILTIAGLDCGNTTFVS